ncbi:MAG: ABC transporter ATP-binding protein [Eubacteriales bacterium]|jgi:ATP-binding cassette subfamily B protein|nr:ABC transporter ATP-binding protein [Eubacteriales bacterium]MDD4743793.1 ABC transporter ATP-binding protein [Eubacteriales bacterium]NLO37781.1 ABC transporter ATP-binding protein [Clostridiaceae bacterium]
MSAQDSRPVVNLHHMGGRFAGGQKPRDMRGTIIRLWKLSGKEKWPLLGIFLISSLSSGVGLIGPWLIGRAVDAIAARQGVDIPQLHRILILLGAAYGAGALLTWLHEWWIAGVAQRIVMLIRRSLFDRVQALPLSFFDTHTHGELMSRLANDVDSVSTMISSSTTQLFTSLLMVLGSLVMMLVLSPVLTGLTLLTVPATILFSNAIAKRARKRFKQQQINLAELNGHVEEILSGQEVVKAFGQEDRVISQFDEINEKLRVSGLKAQILSGLVMPMLNVITNLGFIIVATGGGYLAISGVISVGVIASFINYSRQFARPINNIANLYSTIQSAQAAAERIFDLMDETPEPPDLPDASPLLEPSGKITFDDVTFGYRADIPVLKNISLAAQPGQTIALVGPTGAGKTTIVNLLVRFYDPQQGSIAFDDRDLRSWQRQTLRPGFGMVLQDTHLFSGTIRENIRYGRLDASDAEVEAAAAIVGADRFIQRLPSGYDTELGESGGGFSQGQRQLLSIARAILAEPAVLILDEATSSVDTRTEMLLQQAMIHLRQGRTSFIIAHRLSTIRDADEILVIDNGEIIERGNHRDLMAQDTFYRRMYHGQFEQAML